MAEEARKGFRGAGAPEVPALEAWYSLRPMTRVTAVTLLMGRPSGQAVYRLEGAGPGGTPVIAKRCCSETAGMERIIYEEVLPRLEISAARYYGAVEEDELFHWIFLEDAGLKRFSPQSGKHRKLAAHWLGLLHTLGMHVTAAQRLPERGPGHFLERLRDGRSKILGSLGNSALGDEDVDALQSAVGLFDRVESEWDGIDRLFEDLPLTLVHGDFRPENVRARRRNGVTELLPIDWESAAWGVFAVDLAPSCQYYARCPVDLALYEEAVRLYWPGVDGPTIRRLADAGLLLRRLVAMSSASEGLDSPWPETAVERVRRYAVEVCAALERRAWSA